MIIIRDLTDLHTLKLRIMSGDFLEVYNSHFDTTRYYWVYSGVLTVSYNDGEYSDTCWDSEFFRDIRIFLLNPEKYFVKLVEDIDVEVVTLDEEAVI